jgi:hypothetical protein
MHLCRTRLLIADFASEHARDRPQAAVSPRQGPGGDGDDSEDCFEREVEKAPQKKKETAKERGEPLPHPGSVVNARALAQGLPEEFLVYFEMVQTSQTYLRSTACVSPVALALLARDPLPFPAANTSTNSPAATAGVEDEDMSDIKATMEWVRKARESDRIGRERRDADAVFCRRRHRRFFVFVPPSPLSCHPFFFPDPVSLGRWRRKSETARAPWRKRWPEKSSWPLSVRRGS